MTEEQLAEAVDRLHWHERFRSIVLVTAALIFIATRIRAFVRDWERE